VTPLLVVVGPTAAGKTALAIAVARLAGAEIVGADASQVYRGMDVGTGKATAAELGDVRHHLVDVVDPDAPFDAALYARLADAAIADIRARGRQVVVCGGTGFYLRALLQGLCEAPPVDATIREDLRARIAAGELPAMHAELAAVDPTAAARIAPRDRQRVERALGVYLATGRPLTAWQSAQAATGPRHPHVLVGLDVPSDALKARIAARVDAMIAAGFVAEVRRLLDAGYDPALPSFGALGYRHLAAHVRGDLPLDEARRRTLHDTERYARRQRTWFRALPDVTWWPAPPPDGAVLALLRSIWGRP
jgi:tRNA dimethylallyltransferase